MLTSFFSRICEFVCLLVKAAFRTTLYCYDNCLVITIPRLISFHCKVELLTICWGLYRHLLFFDYMRKPHCWKKFLDVYRKLHSDIGSIRNILDEWDCRIFHLYRKVSADIPNFWLEGICPFITLFEFFLISVISCFSYLRNMMFFLFSRFHPIVIGHTRSWNSCVTNYFFFTVLIV